MNESVQIEGFHAIDPKLDAGFLALRKHD